MSSATPEMNDSVLAEGDDMVSAALDTNTGGRVRFEKSTEVRILELNGAVSKTIYLVDQERSDRKGFVILIERDTNPARQVRVHHRRILPLSVEGKAVVIESSDKYWALCPACGQTIGVETTNDTMECSACKKTFELHWLGVKPMSEGTKAPAKAKADKAAKATTPKAEKAPKIVKEPIRVDLAAVAKLKGCELWTKKNVKFDHERIDVQAHTLLFVGDNPRKLCFNTYSGALGKKAGELPLDAFVAGTTVKGAKRESPWFAVTDLDKARAKLQKDGYEKHS